MKNFITKNNRAFTLVETLVAISIFTAALTGLVGVLAKGLSNTSYSQKAQTATYLAQEGIEYMRNLRDTYMLFDAGGASTGWTDFNNQLSTNVCTGANGCYFNADNLFSPFPNPNMPITQPSQFSVLSCSLSQCSDHLLLYYSSTGSYGYTSGVASGFSRQINISPVAGSSGNEIKVSSTVYWMQGSGSYHVTLSEDLFNWIE